MSYQEKYLKYKAKYIALKSKQSQSQSIKSKINSSNLQLGGKSNNNMLNIDNLTDTPLLSNILDGISQGKTQKGGNLSGALKDTKSVNNLTETPRLIDIWGGHYANKDANKLIKLLSESENNNTEDKYVKINGGAITNCKASDLKKHVNSQHDNKLNNQLDNEINNLCDNKKTNNQQKIDEALKKLIESTIDILTVSDVNDTETVSVKSTGSTIDSVIDSAKSTLESVKSTFDSAKSTLESVKSTFDSAKVAIDSSSAVFKQLNNDPLYNKLIMSQVSKNFIENKNQTDNVMINDGNGVVKTDGNDVVKTDGNGVVNNFNHSIFGGAKKKVKTNKKNFFEESDLFSSSTMTMSDSDLSSFDTTINSSDADL
jgi:hypothetical protein